jgi:hypothetical protein
MSDRPVGNNTFVTGKTKTSPDKAFGLRYRPIIQVEKKPEI